MIDKIKPLLSILLYFYFSLIAYASGDQLIDTAYLHLENGEYYNAVTETVRYRYLYPRGDRYGESLIISGRASFRGSDRAGAISAFQEAYMDFPGSDSGQEGLFYMAMARLLSGSVSFALNNLQEYNYVYREGIFYEDSLFYLCTARALTEDYTEALKAIAYYKRLFPDGAYKTDSDLLHERISSEQGKHLKSPLIAGAASAVVPGLGYVYTENYMLGFFSFATNGAFVYLIYDGYRKKNQFQMIFFSLVELSFYNYSIIGSIKSAEEYNSSDSFKKELIMGIRLKI